MHSHTHRNRSVAHIVAASGPAFHVDTSAIERVEWRAVNLVTMSPPPHTAIIIIC